MTAGTAPEPLTVEQWEQILPLAPVQTGALVQIEHADVDEFLIAAVIESDAFEAVVAPLAASPDFAAEWDLIIGDDPLGWPTAIQVWNAGSVLLEQVASVLGRLDSTAIERLDALYDASLTGERSAVPEAWTGPPIAAQEDLRLLAQEVDLESAKPFFTPASVLADAGTLPSLVETCSEERGVSLDELDASLASMTHEGPRVASGLVGRTIDLYADAPSAVMVALLSELQVPLSRRVAAMVYDEAFRTRRSADVGGVRMARRRGGVRTRPTPPTPRERQDAALQYVRELARRIRP